MLRFERMDRKCIARLAFRSADSLAPQSQTSHSMGERHDRSLRTLAEIRGQHARVADHHVRKLEEAPLGIYYCGVGIRRGIFIE